MSNPFQAALFDELTALYPDSTQDGGAQSYTVAACNGTFAGAHILLTGLTPGLPVAADVRGAHTAFRLFELIPVPVEVSTGAKLRTAYLKNDVNDTLDRQAPFYIYEALKPMYNLLMPTGVVAALAFKTPVEYCKQRETQTFTITLTHAGETRTLTLTVERFPCAVPKAGKGTFQYVNWINYHNVAKYHHLPEGSREHDAMIVKYLRAALFSRQNMVNIPVTECFRLEAGEPKLDEAALLRYVSLARRAGIPYLQGSDFCARLAGQADDDAFYDSLPHDTFTSPDEVAEAFKHVAFDKFDNGTMARVTLTGEALPGAAGEKTLAKMARALHAFLQKHDLTGCWTQCCMDEPNDALAPVYKLITGIVKREMPDVRLLEPVLPTHALTGCIDVYCPSADIYEQDRAYYDGLAQGGAELFVYTCLTPGGAYCNRMLDMQRLRQVYLGWAPAKYPNIKGFLHWGLNQYPSDPYARSCVMFSEQVLEFHPKRAMFLPAGDFCILYPGFDEPLLSTRSEAHRIGLEDLCLLQALDQEQADALVSRVFRGFADYELSIPAYRAARKALMIATSYA